MPTGQSSRSGPPPKPPDKRRNTRTPGGYGLAEPVKNAGEAAKQPPLGFKSHPIVADLWESLNNSVEGRFFSAADWQRARLEMVFIDATLNPEKMTASNWQRVQQGLNELLVSPADKRRAGIELKAAVDTDEEAAVLQMARYKEKLVQ
jgi:hypothetical protein